MPRPSTPRGDIARERILQHAVQIFSERGFDGFTTRELSARAKVNIAAINYYFGHKQGLYDAALADAARRLRERGEQIFAAEIAPLLLERARGPQEALDLVRLGAAVQRVYAKARADAAEVRLLVRQALDGAHLPTRDEGHDFLPSTETATGLLGSALGLRPERARANVVAFNFLLSRYLVEEARTLHSVLGVDSSTEAEPLIVDSLLGTLVAGAST